jgi:predicted MFS family arabinose efflux permease
LAFEPRRTAIASKAIAVTGRLSRRAAFIAAACAFFVTMVGTTLPTPLYPLYQRRFGFSELTVTVIFATYAAGVMTALLLVGPLSDQVGRRPLLVSGLIASALSAVCFLAADGLAPLVAGRAISGLSAGIFTGTATATLVDLAPRGGQGRGTLLATMASIGGLGCGALLAGVLAATAARPLRTPFLVDLALVAVALGAVLLMPEPVSARHPLRWRPQALAVPSSVRHSFVRAALAAFAGFAVLGLSTAVLPAFLGGVLSIDNHAVVGLVVFGVFVASTGGQLLLGVVPGSAALPAGCVGLIGGMALFAAGLVASSLAMLVVGTAIAGTGQGLSFRAGLAAVNSGSPATQRAEVASSFFVVAYLAISIPVIGVGVLADATTLRTAGLVFAALVAALAAVVLVLLAQVVVGNRERPPRPRPIHDRRRTGRRARPLTGRRD